MRWGIDEIPEDSSPNQNSPLEPREDEGEGDEGDDDDDQPFIPVEYEGLRAFLLESDEVKLLFHDLELGLHGKEVDTWLYVRTRIVKELASFTVQSNRPLANYSLAIDLPWMPRRFLNEQYNHLPRIPELGSVITLSGAAENVYAATAEAYIRRTWPRYGPLVLAMLQEALVSSENWYLLANLVPRRLDNGFYFRPSTVHRRRCRGIGMALDRMQSFYYTRHHTKLSRAPPSGISWRCGFVFQGRAQDYREFTGRTFTRGYLLARYVQESSDSSPLPDSNSATSRKRPRTLTGSGAVVGTYFLGSDL
jgi:hypothetical protein